MKGSGTTMAMTATGKNKELGRDGKFSLLKWLQCTCSYSKSTKEVNIVTLSKLTLPPPFIERTPLSTPWAET